MLTIGSLFSGIGGLELGLEWAGLGPVLWQVERDEFCRGVLAKHWPDVERHRDVCSVGAAELAPVDLVCGGFPCQDVSAAGLRTGLAGERSGLWREFARVVGELQPEWIVVENVTSGASLWLGTVVCELGELGYESLPIPLSACDVGAPHLRRRVFVVARAADAGSGALRQQQGWGSGARGPGAAQPRPDGEHGPVADAMRKRQQGRAQPTREEREAWGPAERGGAWAAEPAVGRVAHGVPNRVAQLRALGNAVVPQCAEVVGWVIRELMG